MKIYQVYMINKHNNIRCCNLSHYNYWYDNTHYNMDNYFNFAHKNSHTNKVGGFRII